MTAMSKHTPGPWIIGFDDGSGESYITANQVVVVRGGEDGWGVMNGVENPADARLIAAAPDLLEALERIVACDPYKQSSAAIIAREAIAKARGES